MKEFEPSDMIALMLLFILILLILVSFFSIYFNKSSIEMENLDLLLAFAATVITGIVAYIMKKS